MRITYYKPFLVLFSLLMPLFSFRAQSEATDSKDQQEIRLNQFMDTWHRAAAKANAEVFFGMMSEDAVYIGTDKTERWLRDELREWASGAFARESAWTFKATKRNWQIHAENQFAICDELLETWMGPCRSTAVLSWNGDSWQIIHYQLSVTIDNNKIEDFKSLQELP